jgi:chromosome segregation ATPase
MFVTRARFDQLDRQLQREVKRRQDAEQALEQLAADKQIAITRMQGLVEQHRDQHPDAPLNYLAPSPEVVRLRQQLALSEKARRALDAARSELIGTNVQLTREVRELREAAAEGATS